MIDTSTRNFSEAQGNPIKIAYLILACNEEFVIQNTILSVQKTLMPSDALIVVADNCDDDTAKITKENGAMLLLREDRSMPGKSAALVWVASLYTDLLLSYDFIVILDADSTVAENFSSQLKNNLNQTDQVCQCQLVPSEFEASPISTLIALSEIIEQTVFQRLRSLLGLSVRLRGTGMVFKPETLVKFVPKLQTNVEDIALSLLLVEGKVRIRSLSSPEIHDPKPMDNNAASRQRARWFRGQWSSLWKFRRTVLALVLRGPEGWSMLGSIFFKPRWLKILLLLALAAIFYQVPILSAVCLLLALIDLILILIGIALLPAPELFVRSLLHLPGFLIMWIKGIILSFKSKTWQRVRETKNPEDHISND